MVVFTCGHCGESVQKPKVEKHYLTKCRNKNPNLSCMDCFKDFLGNDYETHTKCITEEQRYAAKGFVGKEKKGEKKQNAWVEMLQSVLDEQKSAPVSVLKIIETITKHNNTPRKKPKFVNFVKNVCGFKTNIKDIDQAWDLISVKLSALSNANNRNNQNSNQDKKIDSQNDDSKESSKIENGDAEKENAQKEEKTLQNGDSKKLSKKQLKEEKKRKKYEAELQSAAVPPEEVVDEEQPDKKEKKKKNRSDSITNEDSNDAMTKAEKAKIKKRKRQDTTNTLPDVNEVLAAESTEVNGEVKIDKNTKKKPKVDAEEEMKSLCLHDQNVIKREEQEIGNGKFNWHAVIMSVLTKKGNEIPFKRLQKKVLGEYSEMTGQEVDDRIAEKFIKKLKSAPNVRVDKNRVILLE